MAKYLDRFKSEPPITFHLISTSLFPNPIHEKQKDQNISVEVVTLEKAETTLEPNYSSFLALIMYHLALLDYVL